MSGINQAMLGIQSKIQNPKNTATNPFFHSSYAPLDEILNMLRPILTAEGIFMYQSVGGNGDCISVVTILTHVESGETLKSDSLVIKVPPDPQKAGSAITYGKRYQLNAMFGIVGEQDEDGNVASHGSTNPSRKPGERVTRDPEKKFVRASGKITGGT